MKLRKEIIEVLEETKSIKNIGTFENTYFMDLIEQEGNQSRIIEKLYEIARKFNAKIDLYCPNSVLYIK